MTDSPEYWEDLETVTYSEEDELSAPEPASPDSLGFDGADYDPAL